MQVSQPRSEARIRLRASFLPWYRGAIFVSGILLGAGLWIVGTRGSESFEWAAGAAFVPLVLVSLLILRWQRVALSTRDPEGDERARRS
jgi:hypothetical protein